MAPYCWTAETKALSTNEEHIHYNPEPTARAFHQSTAFVRGMMTWNILICVGLLQGILLDGESLTLWPEAILTAVIGLGLAFVVWQRRVKPGPSLASNP